VTELLFAMRGFPVSTAEYEGDEESLFPAADADTIPVGFSRLPTPFASLNASDFSISPFVSSSSSNDYIANDGSDANDENAVRHSEVPLWPRVNNPRHVFAALENA